VSVCSRHFRRLLAGRAHEAQRDKVAMLQTNIAAKVNYRVVG
jgi:hypothetical protein